FELADAQNGRLGLIDNDRRGDQASAHAVVRNGKGPPSDIRRGEPTLPRADHQVIQTLRGGKKVARLDITENGNHEPTTLLFQCRRYTNVDGIKDLESRIRPTAVSFRH